MSDATTNLRLALAIGVMDPRFRLACEAVLTENDALAARLAEAERLLNSSYLYLLGTSHDNARALARQIEQFKCSTADSASGGQPDLKKAIGDFYHASTPSVGVLRLFLKEGRLPEESRLWIERLSNAYDILDAAMGVSTTPTVPAASASAAQGMSLDETRFRAALGMVGMMYPTDVFPADVFPADGQSQDCKSAKMVRLTLDNVWREYEKLKEAERAEAQHG